MKYSQSIAVLAALFYGLQDNEAQAVQISNKCAAGSKSGKCIRICKPGEDSEASDNDGGDGGDGGNDGGDSDGGDGGDGGDADGGDGGNDGGDSDGGDAATCSVTYTQAAPQYTCNNSLERAEAESAAKDSLWCQGKKGSFSDVSFPASNSSLFYQGKENSEMGQSYRRGVKAWKRISEMKSATDSLWGSKGVLPNGVQQGGLGDCWFLAAAAAVAETPSRIEKMFRNTQLSADGIYQTKFYIGGKATWVTTDDKIPARPWGSGFAPFNVRKSPAGAWWMPILEKAYAKVNVNYAQLNGGTQTESFAGLTGMPIQSFSTSRDLTTADKIWDAISNADLKNWVMSSSCMRSQDNMVGGHAYTVLGAVELKQGERTVHKLIKMRNPWGSERFSGPWSDKSPLWTQDFRNQAGAVDKNDGTFFIDVNDYKKYYVDLKLAQWNDDWKITRVAGSVNSYRGNTWMDIKNPKAQDVTLTCNQVTQRMFPEGCKSDKMAMFYGFYLYKGNSMVKRGQCSSYYGSGSLTYPAMPAGDYKLRIINWDQQAASKKSSFEMAVFAEGASVSMANQAS